MTYRSSGLLIRLQWSDYEEAGHDAVIVLDQQLGGTTEADLARICQQEGRAIISLDLDFTDIRSYPPQGYASLIVLRIEQQDKLYVMRVAECLLKPLEEEPLTETLWIVGEHHIRIRQ